MANRNFLHVGALTALAFSIFSTPLRADEQAMILPVDPVPLVAETGAGEAAFKVEIADDPSERSAGLMYRNFLPDDQGMLFIFPQQQQVGFWMRNTVLPLDIIFIDAEGRIQGIREGKPLSETTVTPGVPVQFVLELKKGTATRLGIEDGDLIKHPRITDPAGITPTNPQ